MPDITITLTTNQASRTLDAVGKVLDLKDENLQPRPATTNEARAWLLQTIKNTVQDQERAAAVAMVVTDPF